MMLQLFYPWILAVGLVLMAIVAWFRYNRPFSLTYRYAFTSIWKSARRKLPLVQGLGWLYALLHPLILLLILAAAARPRTPYEKTEVEVEGVSIMLLLDVSRSMLCFDDMQDQRSRFVIAQEEAINFIKRRPYDQFGLVLFGAVAATRCPLTSDRMMMADIIRGTAIGVVSDEATVLAQAIAMGVRRLIPSRAKSKIIVLLTDGEPSPEDRPHLADALALAKKAHVKIYTIGIGSAQGGFIQHPLGGIVQVDSCLQTELLRVIATKTGGAFFEARNQRDLAHIYQTIDKLEKSVQPEPVYAQWYEWYKPLLFSALALYLLELLLMAWQVIL